MRPHKTLPCCMQGLDGAAAEGAPGVQDAPGAREGGRRRGRRRHAAAGRVRAGHPAAVRRAPHAAASDTGAPS